MIQSFQIPPEKVFPDYGSDYADMDQIRDFEAWMRELEQDGLITIKYGSGEIRKLTANQECWDLYYRSCREGISFITAGPDHAASEVSGDESAPGPVLPGADRTFTAK